MGLILCWYQCHSVNWCSSALHKFFDTLILLTFLSFRFPMGKSGELKAIHVSAAKEPIRRWILGRAQAPGVTFWTAATAAKFLSIRVYLLRNLASTSCSCRLGEKTAPYHCVQGGRFPVSKPGIPANIRFPKKTVFYLWSHFQTPHFAPSILPHNRCKLFPLSFSFLCLQCPSRPLRYGSFLMAILIPSITF